jgi:two-component system phosphate regulon sensor histidine kinase PhoR
MGNTVVLSLVTVVGVTTIVLLLTSLGTLKHRLKALAGATRDMLEGPDQGPTPAKGGIDELSNALGQLAARIKELEAGLAWEREKAAATMSTVGSGVLVLGRDENVAALNETAASIFHVYAEKATGRPFVNLTQDHEMVAIVKRCLETRQPHTGVVQLLGGKQCLELTATPLSKGVLVLVKDLTNIRRLEQTRQDFIANISHDLRTPIASCKAIVETLDSGAISDKNLGKDFLQRMHIEVDKLAQMVNELSELSRIESGELTLKLAPVDVAGLLFRVTERLRAQTDRAQLRMKVECPPDLPKITVDEYRIEQALVNLIHNAIKFTPPKGSITVSARAKGDQVQVSVTDTGIGIPNDELTRIFERFYKVDKARSGGGSGLGLAIAKHIVQAHEGSIWAESTESRGSVFTFSLPTTTS